jgi:hypothetical protein
MRVAVFSHPRIDGAHRGLARGFANRDLVGITTGAPSPDIEFLAANSPLRARRNFARVFRRLKAMHKKCMQGAQGGTPWGWCSRDSLSHARSAEAAPLPHASLKSLHKCAILAFQHAACMGRDRERQRLQDTRIKILARARIATHSKRPWPRRAGRTSRQAGAGKSFVSVGRSRAPSLGEPK